MLILARGSTDVRKSVDGLAAPVQEGFDLDPFAPCLFAFCNRKRDKIMILHWDHNGFWLCYRRLERDRFRWPEKGVGTVVVTRRNSAGCRGLSLEQRQAHFAVTS